MLSFKKMCLQNPNFDNAEKKKEKLEQKILKVFAILRGDPLKNMKKLLKYTDKMIDIFKQFSPCKKGCSNCCYIDVAVSNTEISLIEKFINKKKWNTRIKRNENTIKTIFVREIESGKKFGELSYGKKCPFLRNNECCVYCVRPYFCRKYIIFEKDNKKCGYNNENAYLLNSPITEEVYKKIIKYDTNRDYIPDFNQELFEIRDVFNEGN